MKPLTRLFRRAARTLRAREIVRFNWLLLVLMWALLTLPSTLVTRSPDTVAFGLAAAFAALVVAWTFVLINAAVGLRRLTRPTQAAGAGTRVEQAAPPCHYVFLCLYKEPLALIEKTLASLAAQSIAGQLTVTLAFEERTPELAARSRYLAARFASRFGRLLLTVHPAGVPGELAGKCSNVNFAVREVVRRLGLDAPDAAGRAVVTTCDADNLFHPRHFEELGRAFAAAPDRHRCVWQAPLFYDWQPARSSFLARITGTFRTAHMLGVLVPLQINTMSIQSASLRLLLAGDFYHPRSQMEDILNVVRWMSEARGRVTIRLLPLPLLSGPTSGDGLRGELREWRLQARRWAVGAAEVFHYFLARAPQLPAGAAISWGASFVGYYYLYQMASPLLLLLTGALLHASPELGAVPVPGGSFADLYRGVTWAQAGFLVAMHGLQLAWTRAMGIGEPTAWGRKLLDLALTPATLVGYALVSLAALHEMAWLGKAACGHDPAAKEALGAARTVSAEEAGGAAARSVQLSCRSPSRRPATVRRQGLPWSVERRSPMGCKRARRHGSPVACEGRGRWWARRALRHALDVEGGRSGSRSNSVGGRNRTPELCPFRPLTSGETPCARTPSPCCSPSPRCSPSRRSPRRRRRATPAPPSPARAPRASSSRARPPT